MNSLKRVLSLFLLVMPLMVKAQVHDQSWKSITENKDENGLRQMKLPQ